VHLFALSGSVIVPSCIVSLWLFACQEKTIYCEWWFVHLMWTSQKFNKQMNDLHSIIQCLGKKVWVGMCLCLWVYIVCVVVSVPYMNQVKVRNWWFVYLSMSRKLTLSMYQGWHLADILLFSYIFLRLLIGKKATGLTFLFQRLWIIWKLVYKIWYTVKLFVFVRHIILLFVFKGHLMAING